MKNNELRSPDELYSVLQENAKEKGYLFNTDEEFVKELMNSLYENFKRYGYASCPCRLSSGIYEEDEDLICPCEYMESDVKKYGACFCGLYVSKDIYDGKIKLSSIPESRPVEKVFKNKIQNDINKNKIIWRCTVCGYESQGDNPPDKCLKCGVSKELFVKKADND